MLHAEPTTIHLVFPLRKQYAIPSYQRNYVWTRDGQWEPLWDDLRGLTRQILAEGTGGRAHFLGTIITKQIRAQGFIDRWWVVDGQQRLTTLQILIAAACSAFRERGLTQCASILTNVLVNPQEVVQKDSDKYKIQHKSSDYEGFSGIIETGLGGSDVPKEKHLRLHDCYLYFREALTAWFASVPERSHGQHATALTKAVLDNLQVVDIRLDGHENSHAIFEALNARGEPLTEWEKTKNYILSIAVRNNDPDGDRTYSEYLEQFDSDPYWDQRVSAPRFSGKRIDLFLSFFAQIELPKRRQTVSGESDLHTLPRSRLYHEFRYVGEHVYRKSDEELRGLLERLGHYATIYRQIDQKDDDRFSDYGLLVMHRRDTLNLASLIPVFMVLVDRLGYREDFDRALRIVDSYLMRRVAIKANYSGFDDIAFGYVQAVRDAPDGEISSCLIEEFEKATWASRWPSDDQVVLHLREADMYRGISSARIQLLLRGIAQKMHEERKDDLTMPFSAKTTLTVEHVAPQEWERHWKAGLNFGDSDEDRQRLSRLVHRIGNLTLVTRALNPKLGNRPWHHKAKLLRADNLEMNRRLLNDIDGETWNEREINRRSQIMADYVNEIWPDAATLRKQLGIASPEEPANGLVSGISPLVAERLVDSVTESGIEDGWVDKTGLNRWRRENRYGRYLRLGGGGRWHVVWLGMSTRDRQLVLSYSEPKGAPDRFITIPNGVGFDEVLESVATQLREVADSVAADGEA